MQHFLLKTIFVTGLSFALLLPGCDSKNDQPAEQPKKQNESTATHKAEFSSSLKPFELEGIDRIHTVGPLYLASQPDRTHLKKLKEKGIKTVINLRPAEETPDFDEKQIVHELGLSYYNVPIGGPADWTDATVDQAREILRYAERPLLLHCSSANRVGSIWIPYRVLDVGVPLEKAVKEAKTIGLRSSALEKKARAYVKKHEKSSQQ